MAEIGLTEGDLAKMINAELKDILHNLGRKKNGNKASLIKRILCATDAKNAQEHSDHVPHHQCLDFKDVFLTKTQNIFI